MNQYYDSTDIGSAIQALRDSGLMISTCSIYEWDGTVADSGQPDLTNLTAVSGLQNIVAMCSVVTDIRPDLAAVARLMQTDMPRADKHVILWDYYSAISQDQFALIDGTLYQIQASECDSQHTYTRLGLRTLTMGVNS